MNDTDKSENQFEWQGSLLLAQLGKSGRKIYTLVQLLKPFCLPKAEAHKSSLDRRKRKHELFRTS